MKQHIKHWYPKDQTFFKVLSIAGNIKGDDANKLNISDSRLRNYEKDHLIEQVTYPSRYHQQTSSQKCYCLTKQGKAFVNQKYGISRCQSGFAAHHNCKVAEVICNLNKQEIDSLRSEWESRDLLEETLYNMRQEGQDDEADALLDMMQQGKISCPDITYVSNGQLVCVEVTTPTYRGDDIEAKMEFANAMDVQIEFVQA